MHMGCNIKLVAIKSIGHNWNCLSCSTTGCCLWVGCMIGEQSTLTCKMPDFTYPSLSLVSTGFPILLKQTHHTICICYSQCYASFIHSRSILGKNIKIVRVFFENLMIVVLQKPYQDTSVFKHNRDLWEIQVYKIVHTQSAQKHKFETDNTSLKAHWYYQFTKQTTWH